jgi:hypothetical protein
MAPSSAKGRRSVAAPFLAEVRGFLLATPMNQENAERA